jgi:glyoxylase-like metal-dependent hydrolase (beta-lactamase superfamily II)
VSAQPSLQTLEIARPIKSKTVSTAYVVKAGNDVVIIDTGEAGQVECLQAAMLTATADGAVVRAILLTHAHPDHVGSLAELVAATGLPIYAHALDAALIEAGIPGRPLTPKPALISRFLFWLIVRRGTQTVMPCAITQHLQGHETLPYCGGIRVVPLPGHSAGQVGYLFQASGDMFAGDAVFNIRRLGRGDWHEDAAAETASLRTLSALPWGRLHMGHGPMATRAAFEAMMAKEGLG